jgi:uncharacterized protein (TIGR01777 family)
MKVVLAGGSGALGRRLAGDLANRGHDIVILTRTPRAGAHRQVAWDGVTVGPWAKELAGSVVINLAGELVDRRPTAANISLLTDSRVLPTAALAHAAADLSDPMPLWIQASTLAIYGDAGEELLTESSPIADGPPQMAGVAKAWEAAAAGVHADRQVILRTSIAFERGTPAMNRLSHLVQLGLGGRIASGRQWISWIHIDDWLRIVNAVMPADDYPKNTAPLEGIVIATAPNPVRNAELMAGLRAALHRPPALPTPAAMARLGALLLRTDPALALTGRRAVPQRLLDTGFRFRFPTLTPALVDLIGRSA